MKQVGSRRMSKSNNILQYCSFWNTIPLTPNLFGGVFPPSKVFFLSVSPNDVVGLFGIDVEHVLPCRPDPLGGDCDEAEEKALHPVRGLHPEHAHERQRDDVKVEVGGHGGEQQKHGVLVHERLGHVRPAEVVVLPVEDLLRRPALVVVEDDLYVPLVPVVGQYAAVGILPVEEVELLALSLPLPLHDEAAVADTLELLEGEGLHLVLLVVYLHLGPARLPLHLTHRGPRNARP